MNVSNNDVKGNADHAGGKIIGVGFGQICMSFCASRQFLTSNNSIQEAKTLGFVHNILGFSNYSTGRYGFEHFSASTITIVGPVITCVQYAQRPCLDRQISFCLNE